jgi:hypothetical protein
MQSIRYSFPVLMKLKFSWQISYFMKIRPVGAELFHEVRRTDMAKLIVAFHSFANSPKM